MSGSKNRKEAKNNGKYNRSKNEDATRWSEKIKEVSNISFKPGIKTREDLFTAIKAYFEVLKYAFPKDIIQRKKNVDINLVGIADSLKDDLDLATLKNKNETQTVKWLAKIKTLFSKLKEIYDLSPRTHLYNIKLLSKAKRGDFKKLLQEEPKKFFVGQRPLFKYETVKTSLINLNRTIQRGLDNMQTAIGNLSKQTKYLVHST